MNKQIVHDALILTAFTLVLGLIVGAVYGITKEPREAAAKAATEEAYKAVFAEAEAFEPYEAFDSQKATAFVTDAGFSDEILDVQCAYDSNDTIIGYVIMVKAKDGSQGSITFSVGIKEDGTVNGYSITETGETPGLGLKASDPAFADQFADKLVDQFTVVKQTPAADGEVEAITGSTITSKAMANGCNAALLYFNNELAGGVEQ